MGNRAHAIKDCRADFSSLTRGIALKRSDSGFKKPQKWLAVDELINNMTTKPTDLIAIANPTLAKKLADEPEKQEENTDVAPQNANDGFHKSFRDDVWKAVFTLNLIRYALAIFFLGLALSPDIFKGKDFQPIDDLIYPGMFLWGSVALLVSAVCFTILTKTRKLALSQILTGQFAIDLIITSALVHSTGSITSSFALLYLMVVTTGSVILSRKYALALAAGAIILLFYEHFYSIWAAPIAIKAKPGLLAGYGILLFFSGWVVSFLAKRLRAAELKTYIPSNESIEEYLVRQEIRALKSALASTDGNKTEAAKLLGMTFRSFRYKLTKYDIG